MEHKLYNHPHHQQTRNIVSNFDAAVTELLARKHDLIREQRRTVLDKLVRTLYEIRDSCEHSITGTPGYGAHCIGCGERFGWYCEESPSLMCEYDDEYPEYCIYCGEPEERK
jgi:hypothetical protein